MYQIKFAFSGLWRNKSRYILFGILFAVLGTVWLICLLLGRAADTLQNDLIEQYGKAVVVDEIGYSKELLSEEVLERFNDPKLVEYMEYIGFTKTNVCAGIKNDNASSASGLRSPNIYHMVGFNPNSIYNPFTRRSDPYQLTRGRMVEADNECVIFDDLYDQLLAENLITGLGDVIPMRIYLRDKEPVMTDGVWKHPVTLYAETPLTLVGTLAREATGDYCYQTTYSIVENPTTKKESILSNTPMVFFVTTEQAKQYPGADSLPGKQDAAADIFSKYTLVSKYEVVYHLRSLDCLDEFEALVQSYNDELVDAALLPKFEKFKQTSPNTTWEDYLSIAQMRQRVPAYRAHSYLDKFNELLEPLKQVGEFTQIMNVNLTLLAAALLIILTVLNLYAYAYEIGVLRCIGMSRLKISLHFLLEQGIFLLISLGLGLGTGALLANQIVPRLLDEEYRVYLQSSLSGLAGASGTILAAGLILTLITSVGSAIYIQHYRPLTILRNRS